MCAKGPPNHPREERDGRPPPIASDMGAQQSSQPPRASDPNVVPSPASEPPTQVPAPAPDEEPEQTSTRVQSSLYLPASSVIEDFFDAPASPPTAAAPPIAMAPPTAAAPPAAAPPAVVAPPPPSVHAGQIIVVAGPPGAGKGTQCKRLASAHGLVHLSTGDVFRDAVARRTDLGIIAEAHISTSRFVPDDIVVRLVRERLAQPDARARGVLLDGFPRTAAQAQALTDLVNVNRFVLLQLSDEQCVDRVLSRRIDPLTGDIYNLISAPPPQGDVEARCVRREVHVDDGLVRSRLQVYHSHLGLILPYFTGKIQVVGGAKPVADVARIVDERLAEEPTPPPPPPEAAAAQTVPLPDLPPTTPAQATAPPQRCVVCMEKDAEYLIVPCGHQCGCVTCLGRVQAMGGGCPICRRPIEGLVRVFQSGMANDNSNDTDAHGDVATTVTAVTTPPALPAVELEGDGWDEEEVVDLSAAAEEPAGALGVSGA